MSTEEGRLTNYEVLSYAFGEFTLGLMMWVPIAYLAYYFTDVAKIAAATVGTIMLITHIADAVSVPLAGSIIQKVHMKWGQFRSWLIFAPITTFIFFSLLFAPLDIFGYTAKCILICVFYITAHVSINFAYVAHLGLISVMGTNPKDRVRLSTIKSAGATSASIVFSVLVIPVLNKLNATLGPQTGFFLAAVALSATQIAGYWTSAKIAKKYDVNTPQKADTKETKLSWPEMMQALFGNKHLLLMMFSDCSKQISAFVILGMAAYYFQYIAGSMALMSMFMLLTTITAFGYSVSAPYLLKVMDKKQAYIFSSAVAGASFFGISVLGTNSTAFIVLSCIGMIGYALGIAIGPAMYMDAAEYSNYLTGKDCSAFVMSMFTLPIKIGTAMATTIIGYGLAYIGFTAGMEASPEFVGDLLKLISYAPAFVCFLSAILMCWYKLNDTTVADYMQKNADRRNGGAEVPAS